MGAILEPDWYLWPFRLIGAGHVGDKHAEQAPDEGLSASVSTGGRQVRGRSEQRPSRTLKDLRALPRVRYGPQLVQQRIPLLIPRSGFNVRHPCVTHLTCCRPADKGCHATSGGHSTTGRSICSSA